MDFHLGLFVECFATRQAHRLGPLTADSREGHVASIYILTGRVAWNLDVVAQMSDQDTLLTETDIAKTTSVHRAGWWRNLVQLLLLLLWLLLRKRNWNNQCHSRFWSYICWRDGCSDWSKCLSWQGHTRQTDVGNLVLLGPLWIIVRNVRFDLNFLLKRIVILDTIMYTVMSIWYKNVESGFYIV